MNNRTIVAVLMLFFVILAIGVVSAADVNLNNDLSNKTQLNVSSRGPVSLNVITYNIESQPEYNGYDNNTLSWMKSLGSKCVFVSPDAFVVMSGEDAGKLPSKYVEGQYIEEFIKCDILENHSLGNSGNLKYVLLVENVTYVGQEIHYM